MKRIKLLIFLASIAVLFAACKKEVAQNPYTRNIGEEYIEVSTDTLDFPGRGASLTFIVSCSYDSKIVAPEWVTLTSLEIPGDCREFTVTATAPGNSAEGGKDRQGEIQIISKTLTETIYISQPYYERPPCPTVISTLADFRQFVEAGPFYEAGEIVVMENDINLEGVTLEYNVSDFKGVLNANGNRLTNWTTSFALFAQNHGLVNGLVIDASCCLSVVPDAAEINFAPIVAKNYGIVSNCVNYAAIDIAGEYSTKMFVGGIVGYNDKGGSQIISCVNRGEIKFHPTKDNANAYLGGITGYSFGDIKSCETYGHINCTPAAFSGEYYMIGGITSRQETGELSGNIVHKEAKLYTNTLNGTKKSYIGGIVGYVEGAPTTSENQVYCDIEVNIKAEAYVGALQAWQAKVDKSDMPNATLFEGSIVNSNITAYTKGKGQYGNNPCLSAGFVTGRFSGQKGKATTLHYGTAEKPIKVSGSITCLETNTKKVAAAKDYQAMLDGDGSATSVNGAGISETDYGNILYEVRGDGQTGDPESLDIKLDNYRLEVPMEGGSASFGVKVNYDATVGVAAADTSWLAVDTQKVEGDGAVHDIVVIADENPHTYTREGIVTVKMGMGTTQDVIIVQKGNTNLPESLEVSVTSIEADPAGTTSSTFELTANYDAQLTASQDWIKLGQTTVTGDEKPHTVSVDFEKNQSGAARQGEIVITLPKGLSKTITVNQEKFVYVPKTEIGTVNDFLDFMTYANDAELYPAGFEVKLIKDIDLKNKTVGTVSNFVATIDGQGYSLKNIKSDVPVFGINKGIIKNIVLDSSCAFTFDLTKAPTSGSVYWVGALCGNCDGGEISGCTNKASVNLTSVPDKQSFIGGITGRTAASVTLKNCTNEGAISIKPSALVTAECRIGGIVGGCNGSLENCVNNAPIEYSPADVNAKFLVGGVAAYFPKDKSMKNCINKQKGTVTVAPTVCTGATSPAAVGGLLAYVDGTKDNLTTIENSKNFGDVKTTGNDADIAVGGLVGWIAAGKAGMLILKGCAVNCNVTAVTPAQGTTTSTNPLESAGLILGNKKVNDGVTCTLGTDDDPVKVAGSITVYGGATTVATSENYTNFVLGNGAPSDLFGGSTKFIVKSTFKEETKE